MRDRTSRSTRPDCASTTKAAGRARTGSPSGPARRAATAAGCGIGAAGSRPPSTAVPARSDPLPASSAADPVVGPRDRDPASSAPARAVSPPTRATGAADVTNRHYATSGRSATARRVNPDPSPRACPAVSRRGRTPGFAAGYQRCRAGGRHWYEERPTGRVAGGHHGSGAREIRRWKRGGVDGAVRVGGGVRDTRCAVVGVMPRCGHWSGWPAPRAGHIRRLAEHDVRHEHDVLRHEHGTA